MKFLIFEVRVITAFDEENPLLREGIYFEQKFENMKNSWCIFLPVVI